MTPQRWWHWPFLPSRLPSSPSPPIPGFSWCLCYGGAADSDPGRTAEQAWRMISQCGRSCPAKMESGVHPPCSCGPASAHLSNPLLEPAMLLRCLQSSGMSLAGGPRGSESPRWRLLSGHCSSRGRRSASQAQQPRHCCSGGDGRPLPVTFGDGVFYLCLPRSPLSMEEARPALLRPCIGVAREQWVAGRSPRNWMAGSPWSCPAALGLWG